MTYLITQTFVFLLIAALLGLILGWYLTRISANSARASLQARLNSAEADARELRTELDDAVTARGHAESERQKIADELAGMRERLSGAAEADDPAFAALQGELDACREQLEAASTVPKPAVGAPSSPIAKVSAAAADAAAAMVDDAAADETDEVGTPPLLADDGSEADDLQQIRGIGPKIAGILNELGIRRFDQIANWSAENVAWVNDHLRFKGRIEREEWIPQAKALLDEREAG